VLLENDDVLFWLGLRTDGGRPCPCAEEDTDADGAWVDAEGRGGLNGVSSGAACMIVAGCTSDRGSGRGGAHAEEGGLAGRNDFRIFLYMSRIIEHNVAWTWKKSRANGCIVSSSPRSH
jgi:hypothetical protein